jgi:DNA invertase Pin-like site-specific DNA recombinase
MENQRNEIKNHPLAQGQEIEFVEEVVSGSVDAEDRKLGDLIKVLTNKDTLIVSDVSRLGRNTLDVASTAGNILKKKARLIFARENWELKDELGSEIHFFALNLAARIERSMISARTKSALQRKKDEGAILGRPTGSVSKKLTVHEKDVLKYHNLGLSYSAIGKMYGVTRHTVRAFVEERRDVAKNEKQLLTA